MDDLDHDDDEDEEMMISRIKMTSMFLIIPPQCDVQLSAYPSIMLIMILIMIMIMAMIIIMLIMVGMIKEEGVYLNVMDNDLHVL